MNYFINFLEAEAITEVESCPIFNKIEDEKEDIIDSAGLVFRHLIGDIE